MSYAYAPLTNDWAPDAPLAPGERVEIFTQVTIASGISFRREWRWLPATLTAVNLAYEYTRDDGNVAALPKKEGQSYIRRIA